MKTKTINKKLSLNKMTVSHLENEVLREIKGGTGTETFYITCGKFCI